MSKTLKTGRWTPAEEKRAKAMMNDGKKNDEIAEALNRTYKAVAIKRSRWKKDGLVKASPGARKGAGRKNPAKPKASVAPAVKPSESEPTKSTYGVLDSVDRSLSVALKEVQKLAVYVQMLEHRNKKLAEKLASIQSMADLQKE